MTIATGSRLGPYEILSPIGAGGMGEVYKARDTRLERSVAIKILPAEFAENAQLKVRFEREAKTISQLTHPHICTLHDVGNENGVEYLVMELLDGESLAERLSKGPLPMEQVLRYGAEIAEALHTAHRAGVVHRDLKPGNIMLTRNGAKLLDFGLAKPSAAALAPLTGATVMPTEQKPLTREGTIVGTFQYMAPEQLEAEEADSRTDIFALGAVLYEMTTGNRAFEGKTRTSLIASIVSGEPRPISDLQPLTPPALEHVVAKCLVKDRDARWQSAYDIAEELRWIAAAGPDSARASETTPNRPKERAAWAAGLIVVAIASWFVARTFNTRERRVAVTFSIPTVGEGFRNASAFAVRPDGRAVAFAARDENGYNNIWLRTFDELTPRKIGGSQSLVVGCFSFDGQSLLAVGKGKMILLSLTGGAAQVIADVRDVPSEMAMTRDGVVLFSGNDGRIFKIASAGASPVPLTSLNTARHEIAHTRPRVLPDQEHFLFTSFQRDPNATQFASDLYAGSIDGTPARRIGPITSNVEYAAGSLFFVRDGTLLAAPFDAKTFRFTGEPQAVVDGVNYFKQAAGAAFAVSANGEAIIYQTFAGNTSLAWFDLHGQRLATVADGTDINAFGIAPDDTFVYTSERRPPDGVRHLWRRGLDRESTTPISYEWAWEQDPVITRDGKSLFYASDRLDYPDIYVKASDSSEAGRLVVREHATQIPCDVSPDGRFLLYMTRQDAATTAEDLWIKPLVPNGQPYPFVRTPSTDVLGRFSPDGRFVSYTSVVSGIREVYVKPFPGPGEARQVSVQGGTLARWSPDGRLLYFVRPGKVLVADMTQPRAEPRVLFDFEAYIRDFDVSHDGKRLLFATSKWTELSPPLNVITGWRPPSR